MARNYRSRLAQKESKRMMRQSIMLFVLTGGIVAALIFWGIPGMVKVAGFLGVLKDSSSPIADDDKLAPYAPQLIIPYEATASAQITINGFAEQGTSVKLFNNDTEISLVDTNENGEFSFESIRLENGENKLAALSIDTSGNESNFSKEFFVSFDDTSPLVEISEPEDAKSFYGNNERTITVKGSVDEEVDIFVNDRLTFANTDNNFSQTVRLEPGENTIKVKAIDLAGNETTKEIKVNFSE